MKLITSPLSGVLVCIATIVVPITGTSQTTDQPKAIDLYQSAAQFFEAQDFSSAIRDYESLLKAHPDFTRKRDAHFYKGMAHYYLHDYSNAASELDWVRNSLPDLTTYQHAEKMLLYLAFCQHQTAISSTSNQPQQEIRNALDSFDQFLKTFPDSELAAQAWFFRGQALEDSSRLTPGTNGLRKATIAYQKVIDDFPKSNLQAPAKFALGKCREAMADFPAAAKAYRAFLKEFPQDPMVGEVRIRLANALLQRGLAMKQSGSSQEAKDFFTQADEIYQNLIDNPRYPARADAINQKAYGKLLMEDFPAAADLYAQLANDYPNFEFADEAALNAGKYYFSAGNISLAEKWLNQVTKGDVLRRPEATHWLCRIAIEQKEFVKAIQLAKAQLETDAGDQTNHLQMDMADAMFKIPGREKEAVILYTSIAEANQGQSLAAKASYYAAFGYLRLNDAEAALTETQDFQTRYPQSEFLPEVLEIQGQAASSCQDYSLAKSAFESLVNRFPNHPRNEWWQTQIGMADLLDKNYATAIDYLVPTMEQLEDPKMIAEALSTLSTCYMEQGDVEEAIKAIDRALEVETEPTDISHLRLKKAKALARQQNFDRAVQIAEEVWKNQKESETAFLLGAWSAETDHHEQAIAYFREPALMDSENPWRPQALLGISSSLVDLNRPAKAIQTAKQLGVEYPNHEAAKRVILVKSKAHQITGDTEQALADVSLFLNTDSKPAELFEAGLVKSLCQSDLQDWEGVIATLTPLTQDLSVNRELADDVLFYLAWAHKKNDQEAKSLELFDSICGSFEESPYVAEANYHLGQSHYRHKEYASAIPHFRSTLAGDPSDMIGERAAYRLAWCFYQQGDYSRSQNAFQQQTERYPKGPLNPIGLTMLAESHFQLAQHAQAISVFKVAIPAIESSDIENNLRALGPIHAAQSANYIDDFEAAKKYANLVITNQPDSPFIADAWYELGLAEKNSGQVEEAATAWEKAMQLSLGETGAKARCSLGQLYYQQDELDAALIQFKLVINGYGGLESEPVIQPWQALAAYEAARCYYDQSAQTSDLEIRQALLEETKISFEWLVRHFPKNPLSVEAQKQLQRLNGSIR